MKRGKFYGVWKGRRTGVFDSWSEAEAQVKGFPGAEFKAFDTRAEAELALRAPYSARMGKGEATSSAERWNQLRLLQWEKLPLLGIEPPILRSYSTDAACGGNPGILEYRCVKTESGEVVFARGPYVEGTNNIGEFLAVVETLMLLVERGDALPIYTDSEIARGWVEDKTCKTQLPRTRRNAKLFGRIARAEEWLRTNKYPNKILKWDTENWGEIPADYGRK
ncbi:MAG TPA: ribonuclease H family protein [Anaerolineae bacterium]|nr:ribonuclease H family protein [Anaerolineae bacterium]